MPGIMTSSVIASGRSFRARRRPSSPPDAVTTRNPSLARKRCIRSRTAASSSITSTVLTPGGTRSSGTVATTGSSAAGSATLSRQPNGERAASARLALDGDVAAHHPAEPPAQRQAETGSAVACASWPRRPERRPRTAARAARASCRCPVSLTLKTIQSWPSTASRATASEIVPRSVNLQALLRRLKRAWRTFVRSARIAPIASGQRDLQAVRVLRGQRLDHRGDVADEAGHVEALEVELHLAGLDLGEIEHGVDQLQQVLAGRVDLLEVVRELLGAEVGRRPPGASRCSR